MAALLCTVKFHPRLGDYGLASFEKLLFADSLVFGRRWQKLLTHELPPQKSIWTFSDAKLKILKSWLMYEELAIFHPDSIDLLTKVVPGPEYQKLPFRAKMQFKTLTTSLMFSFPQSTSSLATSGLYVFFNLKTNSRVF